jgi:hypothetical protein
MTDHEAFLTVSAALTGLDRTELPEKVPQRKITGKAVTLGEIYFDRLKADWDATFVKLLDYWKSIQSDPDPAATLTQKLGEYNDDAKDLRVAARQVCKIWYLSIIDATIDAGTGAPKGQKAGDLGQFQNAVIYSIIGAPVSGYSNLPHGYWRTKPAFGDHATGKAQ